MEGTSPSSRKSSIASADNTFDGAGTFIIKTAVGRVPTLLKIEITISKGSLWAEKRPLLAASGLDHQTSVRSAISKASSTSIPRYLTVLSNLL